MNNKILFGGILGVFLILISCAGKSPFHQNTGIKSLTLSWSIPVFNAEDGKIYNLKDSVLIYNLDSLVLYKVAYTYTKYNNLAQNGNTNIISDDPKTIDFSERRFKNFIYKVNSLNGFMYDSLKTKSHLTFDVDSFERKKVFKGSNFYNTSHDKLVKSILSKDKSKLIEKYAITTKPNESYSDSSIYYFDCNLKDINYSFSKKVDSIKGMKLSKMIFIYNSLPKSNSNNIEVPRKEVIIEIKRNLVNNNKEITSLFERFLRDFHSK